MAVDEACSTLATLAPPGARLRCRFKVDLDRITVTARITGPGAAMISRDTFGWRVLNTLTDKVEVLDEDETGTSSLGIRLIKERRTGAA
jgi:serine/threonine-protein kinase RsbW